MTNVRGILLLCVCFTPCASLRSGADDQGTQSTLPNVTQEVASANAVAARVAALLDRSMTDWSVPLKRKSRGVSGIYFFKSTFMRQALYSQNPCAHGQGSYDARTQCAPTQGQLICAVLTHEASRRLPWSGAHAATDALAARSAAIDVVKTAGWKLAATLSRAAADSRLPCGRVNRIDGRSSQWYAAVAMAGSMEQSTMDAQEHLVAVTASGITGDKGPSSHKTASSEAQFEFVTAMLGRAARAAIVASKRPPVVKNASAQAAAEQAAWLGLDAFQQLVARDVVDAGMQSGRRMLREEELDTDQGGDPRRWVRAKVQAGHRKHTPMTGELSCMEPGTPLGGGSISGDGSNSGYHQGSGGRGLRVFNQALLQLSLQEGRVCPSGGCNAKRQGIDIGPRCSRLVLDGVITRSEAAQLREYARSIMKWPSPKSERRDMYEQARDPQMHARETRDGGKRCCAKKDNMSLLHSALLGAAKRGNIRGHLQLLRWVEWQRRAVAREYGVPLAKLHIASSYVTRISALHSKQTYANIHSDQSSFNRFHFTNTLYLSTHGTDFRGGTLTFFNDNHNYKLPGGRPMRMASLSVEPAVGRAVLLSSGWENIHQIDRVSAGGRLSIQTFFTTTSPGDANATKSGTSFATEPRSSALEFVKLCVLPTTVEKFGQCQRKWATWFTER